MGRAGILIDKTVIRRLPGGASLEGQMAPVRLMNWEWREYVAAVATAIVAARVIIAVG